MNTISIRSRILLGCTLIAFSCKHTPTESSLLNNSIIGTWNWVDSKEVYPPGYYTPANTGHTKGYFFSSDSTYIQFRDSQSVGSGHFTITEEEFFATNRTVIIFIDSTEPYDKRYFFDITNGDTLSLKQAATDAGVHRYTRKK